MTQTNQASKAGLISLIGLEKGGKARCFWLVWQKQQAPSKETDRERLFSSLSLACQLSDKTIDEGIALHIHTDIAGMRTI